MSNNIPPNRYNPYSHNMPTPFPPRASRPYNPPNEPVQSEPYRTFVPNPLGGGHPGHYVTRRDTLQLTPFEVHEEGVGTQHVQGVIPLQQGYRYDPQISFGNDGYVRHTFVRQELHLNLSENTVLNSLRENMERGVSESQLLATLRHASPTGLHGYQGTNESAKLATLIARINQAYARQETDYAIHISQTNPVVYRLDTTR